MDKNFASDFGLVSNCENFGVLHTGGVFDPDLFILMSDPENERRVV